MNITNQLNRDMEIGLLMQKPDTNVQTNGDLFELSGHEYANELAAIQ